MTETTAIISVQKSDQDMIQFQVWMIIFGLNVLLALQLYKLAILVPGFKLALFSPIFSPFCKSDTPIDFYQVNAGVGVQNRQFVSIRESKLAVCVSWRPENAI